MPTALHGSHVGAHVACLSRGMAAAMSLRCRSICHVVCVTYVYPCAHARALPHSVIHFIAIGYCTLRGKKKIRDAWRVTMAPRQLRLEPIEVDTTADKGSKRVRVDSTEH
eukprot:scaffold12654_cov113-Isochrysis_galbana.AAC.1